MRTIIVTDSLPPRVDGISVASGARILELRGSGVLVGVLATSSTPLISHNLIPADINRVLLNPIPGGQRLYPIGLISASHIARIVTEWKAEVVEIHTLGTVGLAALRMARRLGIPARLFWHTDLIAYAAIFPNVAKVHLLYSAVLAPHSWRPLTPPQLATEMALGEILRSITWIVAPSEKATRQVRSLGYLGPVELQPTPLNLPKNSQAQRPDSPTKPFVYSGRISREKNIGLLLLAFDLVIAAQPEAKLRFVGPADDRRTLRGILRKMRQHPNAISLLGGVSRPQALEEMRNSTAVVVPSLTEMQCLVIREALHLHVPTIVVDSDLATEYSGDRSLHVASPDAASLAEKMVSMVHPGRVFPARFQRQSN